MKSNNIILLLIICIPFLIKAQSSSSSIDLIGGFDFTNRSINYSGANHSIVSEYNIRDEKETAKYNYHFGANYNQKLAKNICLKLGVHFISFGYKGEKLEGLMWGSEFNGGGGWEPDPNLPHEIQKVYDYRFVEIPVMGRYEFNANNKMIPFFELGFSSGLYTKTKITERTDIGNTQSKEKDSSISKVNVSAIVGLGIQYKINQKWALNIGPSFQRQLIKLKNYPIKEYSYRLSIETGVRMFL